MYNKIMTFAWHPEGITIQEFASENGQTITNSAAWLRHFAENRLIVVSDVVTTEEGEAILFRLPNQEEAVNDCLRDVTIISIGQAFRSLVTWNECLSFILDESWPRFRNWIVNRCTTYDEFTRTDEDSANQDAMSEHDMDKVFEKETTDITPILTTASALAVKIKAAMEDGRLQYFFYNGHKRCFNYQLVKVVGEDGLKRIRSWKRK